MGGIGNAGNFYSVWFPANRDRTMKIAVGWIRSLSCALACASLCAAGKQRIILRLKEPLRAEKVTVHAPGISDGKGETRDLEAEVDLGPEQKADEPKTEETGLKLGMSVRNSGKAGIQVTLTLPEAGYVEVSVMDFYGKHLATLVEGNLPPGIYPLQSVSLKDADGNGIKFLTLRVNGKVVLKKVITKVR
jgi:hypothetical protein